MQQFYDLCIKITQEHALLFNHHSRTSISIIIKHEQPLIMLMMDESNEVNCFSWITNLILQAKPR